VTTVFLDRDGVINRKAPEGDYVKSWQEFEFLPGVFDALRLLKEHGFRLIVVTNQRGISRGMYSEQDLAAIHARMLEELEKAGCGLDAIYHCPHASNSCDCRKPATGLFLRAKKDFPDIDFADSFMLGDTVSDMQAGQRLACKKVLIGTDNDRVLSDLRQEGIRIDFSAPSLIDAVREYLIDFGMKGA
jgi:D-glycero-D-manno-heptose 1,7-bisphosphate phosphatase